jgi:hypothetical protein
MDSPGLSLQSPVSDVLTLARRFEPVLRFTQGELWSDRMGIGLPFIDYRRGDGPAIGPGTDRTWTPVVIDDETPWVTGYRGLWGYDTRDPFGGEQAPAGPRYERDGTIRPAWDRPAAWAGLDKVPPTRTDEVVAAATCRRHRTRTGHCRGAADR